MQAGKSTSFIVDASLVLAFLLPDEKQSEAVKIFDQYTSGIIELVTPTLLPYEIINGLKGALLRKRITIQQTIQLTQQFLDLTIPLIETNLQEVLEISIDNKISVYDSSYLYLSRKYNLELLTLDDTLKKPAK